MAMTIAGAHGSFDYRGSGILLDIDPSLALVRDGVVVALPDRSQYDSPSGADVLEGLGRFFSPEDFDVSGYGSVVLDGAAIKLLPQQLLPVITTPGTQSINEDTPGDIAGTEISIPDSSDLLVTLTVTNGVVSLAQITGLTFDTGDGAADALMTFSGSVSNVNSALETLTFLGTLNFNGAASIAVHAEKFDNSDRADDATINVTVGAVNDAPVVTVPGTQSGTEDTNKSVAGVSIADVDDTSMTVQLSANNGAFVHLGTTTGLTTTGGANDSGTWTFTGTLSDINTALATLRVDPAADFAGTVAVTVSATDSSAANHAPSFNVTYAAVNDAPRVTVPSPISGTEDVNANAPGVIIVDPDHTATQVQIDVSNAKVHFGTTTGLSTIIGANNSTSWVFQGNITDVNTAFTTLRIDPNPNFADVVTVSLSVTDPSGAVTSTSFTVTFANTNDPCSVTVPGAQTGASDEEPFPISGVSVTDPDAGAIEVEFAVTGGTAKLTNVTGLTLVSGANGSAAFRYSGTVAVLNARLASLQFTGGGAGPATGNIEVTVDDGVVQDTDDFDIEILNHPVFSSLPGDDPAVPGGVLDFSSVMVDFSGAQNIDVEVLLDGVTPLYTADDSDPATVNADFASHSSDTVLEDTDPHVVTFRVRTHGNPVWVTSNGVNFTSDGM